MGQAAHQKQDDEAAILHLKRAVELDPNLAMAYATLGVAYGNLTQQSLASDNLKKAFDLKERASQREKFYISGHHYDEDIREVDKAIEVYEQWKKTYPRDTDPLDLLSLRYEVGISTAKFVRKLLNVRPPSTLKFTEITALVPFSTATGVYTQNPGD